MEGRGRATREQRLWEASMSGSVETLSELMHEDRLTLARLPVTCISETPLHIAAMLGHFEFAKALLDYNKGDIFTSILDSDGNSPLHLASANGYLDLVKLLLAANSDVCLKQNSDQKAPLHVAVANGHVDVVHELVEARPEVIQYGLDGGDTVLHLCVKYNRLEVLQLLMNYASETRFLDANITDDNGNTILHMATTLKRLELIKYMVTRDEVKVDAVNRNGYTALDMICSMPKDYKCLQIHHILISANINGFTNATVVVEVKPPPQPSSLPTTLMSEQPMAPPQQPPLPVGWLHLLWDNLSTKEHHNRVEKKADAFLVAASVIAAINYQAMINPPGGVYEDMIYDENNVLIYSAGESIGSYLFPHYYRRFCLWNTISFIASMSTLFMFICGSQVRRKILSILLTLMMFGTISATSYSYMYALKVTTPGHKGEEDEWYFVRKLFNAARTVWLAIAWLVFVYFVWELVRQVKNKRATLLKNNDITPHQNSSTQLNVIA